MQILKYLLIILGWLLPSSSLLAQQGWTAEFPTIGTFSSPRVVDLNEDGVKDIILGAGREEFHACDSAVIAIDGKMGELMWTVSASDQIFGSAIFQDINADGIDEVFIGGRSAELMAINGRNGQVLWRFLQSNLSTNRDTTRWFNFYNPQFIPDQDDDGFKDLLVSNGGDVLAEPYDPKRPSGYLLVISAKTGKLIAKALMPDDKETYLSPSILLAEDGQNAEVVFGTGGETIGGQFLVTSLIEVLEGDLSKATVLDSSENKGYIGPPSRVDLNEDGFLDIVTSAVNGRLLAFDGKTKTKLWEVEMPSTESYSSVAIGFFTPDAIPDVFVSYGTGVWPHLDWSTQIMVNGQNGHIEFKDSLGFYQNTSPLAVDLNGDGLDEVIMSLNFQEVNGLYQKFFFTTLVVIEFKSKQVVQIAPKHIGSNLSSTPWIGDLDDNGFLDILYCNGTNPRHTYTFDGMRIHRLVTEIPIYKPIVWGAYQGSDYNGVFKTIKQAEN